MESKSVKYGLWGAIVAALITGAITLYIHYDGKSEKQKEAQKVLSIDQTKKTAKLKVKEVYLPPVNTRLDSVFYSEIANESLFDAEKVEFSINFGSASVTSCETLPVNVFENNVKFDTSFVVFSYDKIKQKEKLYVYCHLSNPSFDSLLITGENLFSNVEYNKDDLNQLIVEDNSGYITFFKVVGSIVVTVLIIHLTGIFIMLINKRVEKFRVKFE